MLKSLVELIYAGFYSEIMIKVERVSFVHAIKTYGVET